VNGPGGEIQIRDKWGGEILATLYRADLRTGALAGAKLENASLWGEHLAGADLCGVNLREACLRDVNLNDANLARANLQYANATGASLRNADLRGADLREACLSNADLTGAIYDRSTRWGTQTRKQQRACTLVEGSLGGLPVPAASPPANGDTLPVPANNVRSGARDTRSQARPAPSGQRLRPRVGVWLRELAPIILGPPALLMIVWIGTGKPPLHLWTSVVVVAAITACAIRKEFIGRPATLKYWDDGSGFALNVRHLRTGALMLQSDSATLARADLRRANLSGANLSEVNLTGADLEGADLSGAKLQTALLVSANLRGAVLRGANLTAAMLGKANLEGADLRHACLATAKLALASFRDADLRGANFVGRGADVTLWDRVLGPADFTGARWNSATRWPRGFDPIKAGALYETGGEADLPIPHEGELGSKTLLPIPAESQTRTADSASEVLRIVGRT
jgi:uncharacterized protein YjbI with pentapeptide repeats